MFIVVIVLLNMLIALMGDSYDNVRENIQMKVSVLESVCADLLIDVDGKNNIFVNGCMYVWQKMKIHFPTVAHGREN